MVRLSNHNDIDGIIALWKEAFGDSEKDIKFFLDAHYNPENTVVCECDGVIASVLFLLEGDMHIKGNDYPSYYLYAACTLNEYRGRGLMTELLGLASSIAIEQRKFFIALKPAEESLYHYYSRFGYQSVFTKKVIEFNKSEQYKIFDVTYKNNVDFLSELRDKSYGNTNYFKWNKYSFDFAVEHHRYFGGEFISNCNGYMLYSVNDGVLHVKENTFSADDFVMMINNIAALSDVDLIHAELSYNFNIDCSKTDIIKSGMLLPLVDEAKELIKNVDNAYLALTLD